MYYNDKGHGSNCEVSIKRESWGESNMYWRKNIIFIITFEPDYLRIQVDVPLEERPEIIDTQSLLDNGMQENSMGIQLWLQRGKT